MSSIDRRRATRMLLEVPALIATETGPAHATTRDVSRIGVGLRLPALQPTLDVGQTAVSVHAALPGSVDLVLCHPSLPTAIERSAIVTRISLPLEAPDHVDLGLQFESELSDADGAALGVALPPMRGEPAREESSGGSDGPDGSALSPAHTLRTVLTSLVPGAMPAMPCECESLSRETLRVCLPRSAFNGVGLLGGSVAEATVEFARHFGTDLGLDVRRDSQEGWSGVARVCSVELPAARPRDLLLTLAFDPQLSSADLRRLGLEPAAA